MVSIFSYAQESADSTDGINAVAPTQDVSNAGLLEAAMEEHNEMGTHEKSVDMLIDGQEKLEELVDVAAESYNDPNGGLSKKGLQMLKLAFKNIVGPKLAASKLPAMESADINHPTQLTAIALEGVTDTIKQFWLAIKNQMGKFWNSTKSWYLKTFDVANKIIARSKALEEKANALTTTPTEKSFELNGISFLAVDYQVKEPAKLLEGFNNLKNILDGSLDNITKENQNDKSDRVLDITKNLLMRYRSEAVKQNAGVQLTPEELKGLDDALSPNTDDSTIEKLTTQQIGDADMRKKLGVDEQQVVFGSTSLPGNRRLYRIQPATQEQQANNIQTLTEAIKRQRIILSDSSGKNKEMEDSSDVKTLNSSQIIQIASTAGDMGETILKYKKEFEARDRYLNKIVKGFDQIVKDLDGTDVQHPTKQAPKPSTPAPATNQQQQQQQPATNPAPATNVNAAGGGNGQAATTTQDDGQQGDTNNLSKPVDSIDKDIRKLANAILSQFKKHISLSGTILTHSIKVVNAYLTYGERSLAQYGS